MTDIVNPCGYGEEPFFLLRKKERSKEKPFLRSELSK